MIKLTLIAYCCLEARTAQVYDVYRHQTVKACGARGDRLHIQVARGWILGVQTERFPQGYYKNSHAGRVFCDNTTIFNSITNRLLYEFNSSKQQPVIHDRLSFYSFSNTRGSFETYYLDLVNNQGGSLIGCFIRTENNFDQSHHRNIFDWQGGDADSNACVAGAMLGCKLGLEAIPQSWREGLLHKEWLDQKIAR